MRSMHARRRLMESIAKLRALSELESNARLTCHALNEACLHQLAATWLALVRQIADAHGIAINTIESLDDLSIALAERALPSVEADYLICLQNSPDSWVSTFFEHYLTVQCPVSTKTRDAHLIPLQDMSGLDSIVRDRYRPWINAMIDLVDSLQEKFDES